MHLLSIRSQSVMLRRARDSLAMYHVIAGPESLVSNKMLCAVGLKPFTCAVHIIWAAKVRNSSRQFGDVEVDVGAGLQILGWIADETANDILCIQLGQESLRFACQHCIRTKSQCCCRVF